MSSFFSRLNYAPSKDVHSLIFRTLSATFLEEALNNGIETKIWDERTLLDKLVGLSKTSKFDTRQESQVSRRKRFEGRRFDWKENSTQEPRIYGNRCIPQEGHNDAKILLGTLTSGALCHVTVVMAQDRAELLCASPRYHGHM